MRLCRFAEDRIGLVRNGQVFDVTPALAALNYHYPLPRFDPLIAHLPTLRADIERTAGEAAGRPLAQIGLLSPIANPGKIIAAPVNYRKHLAEARADAAIHHQKQVEEIERVGLFLKATSSVVGPSQGVAIRHPDRRTDHEIELAAVIGRQADRVSVNEALGYVAGYCIGLDMAVRGTEDRSFRKSVDTYTVIGPWLTTADEIADPQNLMLWLALNGKERQRSSTAAMTVAIPRLIELASTVYTLYPGDILLTGTPEGVGAIAAGDIITAGCEGLGEFSIAVTAQS